MSKFEAVEGTITTIEAIRTGRDHQENCCNLLLSIQTANRNVINFIADNDTYFLDNENLKPGYEIVAFYDSSLIVPMIYPPQYRAVVMAQKMRNRFIKVDSFNRDLVSSDGNVRLIIKPNTPVIMRNGQSFLCNISGHNVAVVYASATKSYPSVITPAEIIVLC